MDEDEEIDGDEEDAENMESVMQKMYELKRKKKAVKADIKVQ